MPPRLRLRFDRVDFEIYPDGRCTVTVALEWGGEVYRGEAEGLGPLQGRLRTAALATLRATSSASGDVLELGLTGIKTVRAFDTMVVIAAVQVDVEGRHYRLLGAKTSPDEEALVETAARAVLDAINRVFEKYVAELEEPGG